MLMAGGEKRSRLPVCNGTRLQQNCHNANQLEGTWQKEDVTPTGTPPSTDTCLYNAFCVGTLMLMDMPVA